VSKRRGAKVDSGDEWGETVDNVELVAIRPLTPPGGLKPLLGGKGANLAEMSRIGLPVPPGFTITTEVCTYYYANKRTYPRELDAQVRAGVAFIEKIMGTKFGDKNAMPLLVSVRSGARDSMPGMMDTILNLGMNDETVLALVKATQNERFAWDCYRRFIQMYGDVVMGVQKRRTRITSRSRW
jgi:pyruvate, orthophosphate dikinase